MNDSIKKAPSEVCISMPEGAKYVIEVLEGAGYEAYIVGGCVRDSILGRNPDDWDITTSAMPEQVKALFRRTVETGIQHGTITVLIGQEGYEVTTFRVDGDYEDGRHPKQVSFTRSLKEDLLRRDFTINAMAYSDAKGLIDIFGGMEDLEKKTIRCVGNPMDRFSEDALRILRAVRFSAQLCFEIDVETQAAMKALAENLKKISKERIQVELDKLLKSNHPEQIQVAKQLGLTKLILPEYDSLEEIETTIAWLVRVEPDHILRWAALLAPMGQNTAKTVLKRLKFDNYTIDTVTKLVSFAYESVDSDEESIRFFIHKVSEELYPLLYHLQCARPESNREQLEKNYQIFEQIIARGDCVSLKQLALNGTDLQELGIPKGKQIGMILSKLLEVVMISPEKNQKEILEDIVKSEFLN